MLLEEYHMWFSTRNGWFPLTEDHIVNETLDLSKLDQRINRHFSWSFRYHDSSIALVLFSSEREEDISAELKVGQKATSEQISADLIRAIGLIKTTLVEANKIRRENSNRGF